MSQGTDIPEVASGEIVLSVKSYHAIMRTRVPSQNLAHTCHPRTGKVGTGGSLELDGRPASLIGKLQVSEKSSLKSKMGSS